MVTDQDIVKRVKTLLDMAAELLTILAQRGIVVSFGVNQNTTKSEVMNFRAMKEVGVDARPAANAGEEPQPTP